MSTTETPVQQEGRSSVEIATTAAGKATVRVKVYAETLDLDAVDSAAVRAIKVYNDVRANLANAA